MSEQFETNVIRKIYDNDDGTSITVRPDTDGLGLVEVDGGDDYGRVVMVPALAVKVAEAMKACALEIAP
jgi:hypothetical protein